MRPRDLLISTLASLGAARPLRRGAAVAIAAALCGAAPARAQTPSYEAVGSAPLGSGDAVRARAEALDLALRRAVEQAASQAAPEVRGRFYLVSARARDFVTTYRVLEEGEAGGQFQLRAAAQVDLPRLLRALQAAPPRPAGGGREPLLLCAEEEGAAPLLPLLRDLLAARVSVKASGCPAPGAELSAEALAGTSGALLVRAPADLGRTARVRGTTPPLYGAAARVQLSLIGAGRPHGAAATEESAEATEFGATPAEALGAAGRAAAERALGRFLPQLGALIPAEGGVVVTIEGIEEHGQYQQLLRTLSAMPGVAGAEPRRFAPGPPAPDGRPSAQCEILLRTAQLAEPLGAAIGRTPLGGLRLQVVPQDARRLRLLLVRDSALPQPPPAAPPPPPPGQPAPSPSGLPQPPPEGAP